MKPAQHSILIIDDNESICTSLAMILKRKGYVTATAGTAEDALKLVSEQPFDLALLDMKLPDSDGISVLQNLKQRLPDIQVIMITGFASVESVVQTMGDGAAAYITKPLDMDSVLVKVSDCLEKQRLERERNEAIEQVRYERMLLQNLLDSFPDLVFFKDRECRFQRISASYSRFFRTSQENILGKTTSEFMVDKDSDRRRNDDRIVLESEIPFIDRLEQLTMPDGNPKWFLTTKLPWYDESERIQGIYGISRDITDLKQAQESLRRERDRAQLYFNAAGVMLVALDRQGAVELINRTGCELLGYEQHEIIGKNWIDMCIPERFRSHVAALFDTNMVTTADYHVYNENPVLTRTGEERLIAWYNTPIMDEDGEIIGILGSGEDITLRHEAEEKRNEALKLSQQREHELRAIHDASTKLLLYTDFNAAARMLFDSCRELIGATAGYVALLNEEGDENEVLFLEAGGAKCTVDPELPMPIRGLRAESYKSQRVVYDNSFMSSEWMKYMPEGHVELANVMFAPLNIDNKTVGIMGLANKPGGFDDHDAQIASSYGELAAISLSHCRMLDTLRASEEQFKLAVQGTQDGIWDWNLRSQLLYLSPRWKEMIGYADDELPNEFATFENHLHPDDRERVLKYVETYLRGELPAYNIEFRFRHRDGSYIWILARGEALRDENGTPWRMTGSHTDITERKRAEEKLRQSEQLYRSVIDNIGIGVTLISPNMEILTLNNQMKEWFPGIDSTKRPVCYQAFPSEPTTEPCMCCPAQKTFSDGQIHTEEVTHDGLRHFKVVASPIFDMDGAIVAVIEMVEDITEELRIEKAKQEYAENLESIVAERTRDLEESLSETREAHDHINAILRSAAEGIIVTDTRNNVVLMNRASEELLNVRIGEVVGKPIESAINNQKLLEHLHTTMQKKTDNSFTFKLNGNQVQRYLQARISSIHDDSGRYTGKIISFHDITREHEIDRMKTEFISTAAHELRTPLTSILGFSEILCTRNDIDEQETEKYLGYINKQSVRLAKIINEILDISRIESGKGIDLNKAACPINDIITQVTELFQEQAKQHVFALHLPDQHVMLQADPEKIEQLLKNVLSNAVKYSPGGGEITITATLDDTRYRIEISDQGIGMTPDQLEHIFDKFYRADASNTAIEGTGLGMSIVKQIIEAHGGTVTVSSENGRGTNVVLELPR